jgi:predicted metal-dependent phosphoesterase TrpH
VSAQGGSTSARVIVDLHCHTNASFDSLSNPLAVVRAAATRGITHLAITDHDRIDGAQRARDARVPGITVLVGSEVRTREGDLIALFIEQPITAGLPVREAIAAIRAQGGLVGIPHPFDGWRSSLLADSADEELLAHVDWIEGWNARLVAPGGNQRAAELAAAHGIPAVASSDAHTILEVGGAATAMSGDLSTPAGLRTALRGNREMIMGRGSLVARLITPVAKVVNAARNNRRIPAGSRFGEPR